ncbi:MAG: MTAP family purine nucleoside phosphorylase [Chlorobia bacterium]|nr:MTAP family purine nucleoside phosphorylase [Fimbriimonadaceae bacterium]
MRAEVGLIGGTGVGSLLASEPGKAMHVPTPYGVARGRLVEIEGRSVFLLSRHSAGHSVPPHLVNYRAIAAALRQLGAKFCFASAAVGSLSLNLPVGSIVVCSDFLDLTFRNLTLHDRKVIHTPFAAPFGGASRAALLEGALLAGIVVRDGGVYLGLNGPRFETPHEIQMLAKLGDVVGMTASSEAVIMKESGIQYGLLAIVTNLGEGLGGQVDHGMVGDAMLELGPKVVAIFKQAVGVLPK